MTDLSMTEWRERYSVDLRANRLSRWRWYYRWSKPIMSFLRVLRQLEALRAKHPRDFRRRPRYWYKRAVFEALSRRLGYSIPPGVFGEGLSIAHSGTIVVNGGAVVGPFCRLHQGVTIGGDASGVPTIGSGVFIGPNALVIGCVKVGDGASIGAMALVESDVPSGYSALGARAVVRDIHTVPWSTGF